MGKLSPAAKKVLRSYDNHNNFSSLPSDINLLGQALETAVNLVISKVNPPSKESDDYSKGFSAAHVKYREELGSIAKELKNLK